MARVGRFGATKTVSRRVHRKKLRRIKQQKLSRRRNRR